MGAFGDIYCPFQRVECGNTWLSEHHDQFDMLLFLEIDLMEHEYIFGYNLELE